MTTETAPASPTPATAPDDFLTSKQVEALFCVSHRTVATWMDNGELQGFRLPTSRRERRYSRASCVAMAAKYGIPIDFARMPPRVRRRRKA